VKAHYIILFSRFLKLNLVNRSKGRYLTKLIG